MSDLGEVHIHDMDCSCHNIFESTERHFLCKRQIDNFCVRQKDTFCIRQKDTLCMRQKDNCKTQCKK